MEIKKFVDPRSGVTFLEKQCPTCGGILQMSDPDAPNSRWHCRTPGCIWPNKYGDPPSIWEIPNDMERYLLSPEQKRECIVKRALYDAIKDGTLPSSIPRKYKEWILGAMWWRDAKML